MERQPLPQSRQTAGVVVPYEYLLRLFNIYKGDVSVVGLNSSIWQLK